MNEKFGIQTTFNENDVNEVVEGGDEDVQDTENVTE